MLCLRHSKGLVGLLPEVARDAKVQRVLNRSLVAGAALAAIVIGGEYSKTMMAHQRLSEDISQDSARLIAIESFEEQCKSALAMSGAIHDVSALVSETVVDLPMWHGLLGEIGEFRAESIRVQELRGEYVQGSPIFEINGLALGATGKDASLALNEFVNSLEGVDDVFRVTLGGTSRIRVDESTWGRQFSLHIELDHRAIPHEAVAQVVGLIGETP